MKFKNNILLGVILFISCINKIDANHGNWIKSKYINNLNLKNSKDFENSNVISESVIPELDDEIIDIESDIFDLDNEVIDIESDVIEVVDIDIDIESDISESDNEENIESDNPEVNIEIIDIESGVPEVNTNRVDIETGIPNMNTDIFDIETGISEMNTDVFDIETGIPEMNTDIFDIETGIPEFDEEEIDTETDVVYSDDRLPETVLPVAYRLDFYTSIEDSSFDGKEEIDIEILKETNSVVFHSEDLSLSNITISNESEEWKPNSIQFTKENNFVTLIFNETLKSEASYTLHIQYSGKLGNVKNGGYYIAEDDDEDSSQSRIAATQFETADARKTFPCFDEPQFKATFQLNMTVDDGYSAVSNMNVVEIKEVENSNSKQKKYIFANSVKMSTYLVAFMVSKYQSVLDKYNDIDVSVYAMPNRIEDAKYALKLAVKFLKFFEDLFKIPYPLPKLDLVGIPNFNFDGMENWGLIVFNTYNILYNEETDTLKDKYLIARVLSHEISHLWFGDLVTMKWWDDFWLNEGFATYLEYIATDVVEPVFGSTYEWYYDNYRTILDDSYKILESVYNNYSPNPKYFKRWDMSSIYDKGGYIIKMMEFWLNKKNNNNSTSTFSFEDTYFFRKIHEYLDLYKYSNVDSKQLYEMLESYNDKGQPLYHVSEIMESFINQKGIPIVMMNKNQDGPDQTIILSQEQFVSNDIEEIDTMINGNSTWIIPYSYSVYSNSTGKPELLESHYIILDDDDGKSKFTLSLPINNDEASNTKIFIKGNEDQKGYYLVQYDDESIQVACEWLKSDLNFMSYINRAGFISDIFTQLLEDRSENPTAILNCLDYLKNEKSTLVWREVFIYFKSLLRKYGDNIEDYEIKLLLKWISDLTKNIFEEIGWVEKEKEDNENSTFEDNSIYNRSKLREELMLYTNLDEENNRAKALYYYNQIKNGTYSENFDKYTLNIIFSTGIKYGDESDVDFIFNELTSGTSKFESSSLLGGLSKVSDAALLKKIIEKLSNIIESDSNPDIENFNIAILLRGMVSKDYYFCFSFIRDHWDSYFERIYLSDDYYDITSLIEDIYYQKGKKVEHSQEIVAWIRTIDEEEEKIYIDEEDFENEDIQDDYDNNNFENKDNNPIILWLKEHY